jgi:hypothetical protein
MSEKGACRILSFMSTHKPRSSIPRLVAKVLSCASTNVLAQLASSCEFEPLYNCCRFGTRMLAVHIGSQVQLRFDWMKALNEGAFLL